MKIPILICVICMAAAALAGENPKPASKPEKVLKAINKASCDPDPDANPWLSVKVEFSPEGDRTIVRFIPSFPRLFQAVNEKNYRTSLSADNHLTFETKAEKDGMNFSEPKLDCKKFEITVDVMNEDDEVLAQLTLDLETGKLKKSSKKK